MARMAYSLATADAPAELWPRQAITTPPCPGRSALRLASRAATPPGIEMVLGRPTYDFLPLDANPWAERPARVDRAFRLHRTPGDRGGPILD